MVMDVFIANMTNETVQTKLTTEPKSTPDEVLKFAEAYEEGITRQKTYGNPMTIKDEPVYNVAQGPSNYTRTGRNDAKCYRCGFGNFTPAHLKECRARNEICNKCKLKGNFARCCGEEPMMEVECRKDNQTNEKEAPNSKRI